MPSTRITETNDLAATTSGVADPVSTQRVRTTAQADREYVSGGGFPFLGQYAATLPHYVDDLTRDLDVHLYRQMRFDPQVESALTVYTMALLSNGLHIQAAIRKGDPGYERSETIRVFVQSVIDNLETPIMEVLFEMAIGAAYGHKLAELVYRVEDWGDGPKIRLVRIAPKPLDHYAFVVDRTNRVIAILPLNPYLAPVQVTPSPDELQRYALPYEGKFWNHPFHPSNGDPRGTSILRPAYHAWWVKAQVWKAYLAYLATFAQPSVIGFTDPDSELDEQTDPVTGLPLEQQLSKEQLMLQDLMAVQNGSCAAFPGGARVEILQAQSNGEAFQQAIDITNREITKSIIGQTLMTEEGAHMSRAAATTHQDVFGLLIRNGKINLAARFRRDVILPLVRMNFGDEAARDFAPLVSLGETEHQDFPAYASAIAGLIQAGFFDLSQYEGLDALLSVPPRDHDAWETRIKQEAALASSAVQTDPQAGAQAGADGGPKTGGTITKLTGESIAKQVARRAAMEAAGPMRGGGMP